VKGSKMVYIIFGLVFLFLLHKMIIKTITKSIKKDVDKRMGMWKKSAHNVDKPYKG
jgi:hypothetical protein